MTIQLSNSLEQELRRVADDQGRELQIVVEEALRQYLDGAGITDVTPDDVAEAQMKLASELSDIPPGPDVQESQ